MRANAGMAAVIFMAILGPAVRGADLPDAAPAAPPAAAGSAAVNLYRPFRAGATYDVHLLFEEKLVLTAVVSGRVKDPTTKEQQGELTGRVTDIVSDATGACQGFTLTVKHMLSKGHDAMRPGTALAVTIENDVLHFSDVTKSPVPDNAKPLLGLLLTAYSANAKKLDAAFGSSRPVPLDTEWKPSSAMVAAYLSNPQSVIVEPFNVDGTSKLLKAGDAASGGARRLNVSIRCDGFSLPEAGRVVLVESSKGLNTISILLPDDPNAPIPDHDESFDGVNTYTTPTDRGKATATIHARRRATVTVVMPAHAPAAEADSLP